MVNWICSVIETGCAVCKPSANVSARRPKGLSIRSEFLFNEIWCKNMLIILGMRRLYPSVSLMNRVVVGISTSWLRTIAKMVAHHRHLLLPRYEVLQSPSKRHGHAYNSPVRHTDRNEPHDPVSYYCRSVPQGCEQFIGHQQIAVELQICQATVNKRKERPYPPNLCHVTWITSSYTCSLSSSWYERNGHPSCASLYLFVCQSACRYVCLSHCESVRLSGSVPLTRAGMVAGFWGSGSCSS